MFRDISDLDELAKKERKFIQMYLDSEIVEYPEIFNFLVLLLNIFVKYFYLTKISKSFNMFVFNTSIIRLHFPVSVGLVTKCAHTKLQEVHGKKTS